MATPPTTNDFLAELNAAQRQAATFGPGPVLVIAGAGTGKTKTLAARVAYLISQGSSPDRILLLTFTRRAAGEMLSRAAKVCPGGQAATAKVWGGTFHAIANRLLRQYGRSLGLAPEFTVMDQSDAEDLMNLVRSDLGLAKTNRRFPRKATLQAIYSRMVNARLKLTELLELHYPWCADDQEGIKQVFEQYTKRKRAQNVLDYDDLLLYWKALCNVPVVSEALSDRFEHILVDEYQDTNLVQAEILQAMRKKHKNIMVVGDDAQSIYSFRAATVRNILDFPEQFPGAEVIKLEENYRSVQPILDASNAVMDQAKERYTKNLFSARSSAQKPSIVTCLDETEQTNEVCTRILEYLERGIILKKQAVLFRAGHHSDALEVELTRRNIPFVKYGGLKFIEAAHIKDMLAILRLLENPTDEVSWFRLLQIMNGIGPASANRLIESMGVRAANAPSLPVMLGKATGVPSAAKEEFAAFRKVVADVLGSPLVTPPADGTAANTPPTGIAPLGPGSTIERIRRFYDPIFRRIYDNPTVRLRDLDQLEQIATTYKSRSQFITDLTLDPPSSTQDLAGPPLLEEDWITLSTIHSAKGMEWEVVHILHVADGMIPSDMSTGSDAEIDEERRLLYVAMTRAKDHLHLYFPLRYYRRQRGLSDYHSYAQLTRFVPEGNYGLYERVAAPGVQAQEQPEGETPAEGGKGTTASIDSMLDDLMNG